MKIFNEDYRQPKAFKNGTHRTRSPQDTLAAYCPLMPQMGITRLANVTGLDFIGIPVYMCVRPNSCSLAVSQGKGLDDAAAKASALMESIEFWHAERVSLPIQIGTIRSMMSRATVIDMDKIALSRAYLPLDQHIQWVEGFDILRGVSTWVPYDVVDLDFTTRFRSRMFHRHSTGLSSGNHILEAIVHGLCEVIERDAITLWQVDASDPLGNRSIVDVSTVNDPACRYVIDKIRAAGLYVGVQDITSDVGIPTYQCVVTEMPGAIRAIGNQWGMGTHLSPEIALLRALTEAVQARLTQIAGSRDDLMRWHYRSTGDEDRARTVIEVTESATSPLDFQARRSLATDSFEEDVVALLDSVRGVGLDSVVVVNLARPEIGIPVVKVLVPGLEPEIEGSDNFFPGARAKQKMLQGAQG